MCLRFSVFMDLTTGGNDSDSNWNNFLSLCHSVSAQEHIQSQCRSQYIKAKINSSHHKRKAEEVRQALKKSQELMTIKEQELAEEQQEITELEQTWKSYEKQAQEKAIRGRDFQLDEDQVCVPEITTAPFPL